jgi:hypothetical protein
MTMVDDSVDDSVDDAVAELRVGLARIHERIDAAGGDPDRVRVLAVTKGHGPTTVDAAVAAGLADIGESYPQELLAKAAAVRASVRWHWIGRIQRNKVRHLAPIVAVWQSVDRLPAAEEVAARAPGATVLVQVNVSGAPQQGGASPDDVPELVAASRGLGLDVQGLMAIGAQGPPQVVRAGFRVVRDLADRLALPERSMGMSGDLEAAVAEGSTMVRIGTALFGPRGGSSAVGK